VAGRPPIAFRLYLISEVTRMKPSPVDAVARALSGVPVGGAAVQLREPNLTARQLLELGRALLPVCAARQAPLLINDRLDVARTLGCQGVHLGQRSVTVADARAFLGDEALLGVSCHSRAEVEQAQGADFVTIGPVFDTPSKRDLGSPLGLEGVRAALAMGTPPALALGGINLASARLALGAGVQGVAAIRAIWDGDPASQTARLWSILAG
jgi:thiamine-phosphate pyrophosphorylase